MNREGLHRIIRAAAAMLGEDPVVIIRSQSILTSFREFMLPDDATMSAEADVLPFVERRASRRCSWPRRCGDSRCAAGDSRRQRSRRLDARRRQPYRAASDLMFSVPKSVSVLAELRPELSEQVVDACEIAPARSIA